MTTVAVVGATGRTGRRIIDALQGTGFYIVAVVRDLIKAQQQWPDYGVDIRLGDVTQPQTLKRALSGCSGVICATGASPSFNPLEPFSVDYLGTKNLVDAAQQVGVQHFILISSLCVSQLFHPLNLFWLILYWKQQAERYLQDSGLTYTIVRPGGLKETEGGGFPVMSAADTLFEGSISRSEVANICVAALFQDYAKNKIVEVVSRPDQPRIEYSRLFKCIPSST